MSRQGIVLAQSNFFVNWDFEGIFALVSKTAFFVSRKVRFG